MSSELHSAASPPLRRVETVFDGRVLGFGLFAGAAARNAYPPIIPRSILRARMIDVVVRSTPSSPPI